ncbi:alpha/beta fold hydrolase [Rubellimicrobium aerolatum]|uniref:Alpha/beta fold hydrolase n=1 Tax=Rubellimicrobium aerolatum TaxID=490979 RepID=A0ABW0SEQ3_9RHOB|nr:alpha/beta hydrolase [Rubellimicrobium aerolatum]MBP1806928.1 dienelactone hydrolase [Rubellimicrobium aerolatum]
MIDTWLDRWDERRARRSDATKAPTEFALDAHLAFPDAGDGTSLAEFCALADQATTDPAFFDPGEAAFEAQWDDGWIRFPSSVLTDVEANNTVWGKVTAARPRDHALVVLHHWNASSRNPQLARVFAWQGITVVEMAMPYHLERRRPDASHADDMLSPNLGRTIQSMRQAVLDGRRLVRVLKNAGYERVSVLGMSLGSWVAGLMAAHDPAIGRAVLLLTGGSLADMVWTGRATRHIRASLDGRIDLTDLRRAWGPLDLENAAGKLARPGLALQVVLAERDTVVRPELSDRLVAKLKDVDADLEVLRLNCGHYSLSLPPYILRTGLSASRFLKRGL